MERFTGIDVATAAQAPHKPNSPAPLGSQQHSKRTAANDSYTHTKLSLLISHTLFKHS